MLEELLSNSTYSPAIIAMGAGIGLVCLWFGWTFKGLGAKRREADLQQDILAAKASVPQLESSVRKGELQVERVLAELKELKAENAELTRQHSQAEKDLRMAQRQVSNLTSEINAVKGVSKGADNMIIDGFDDEVAHESNDDSPLAQRLKKTEAAYEKLKGALHKRDDRIDELEEQLHASNGSGGPEIVEHDVELAAHDADKLHSELVGQRETITALQAQVSDLRQEKEMLEELASRRSKSNRALKEASAEAQGQVPALQQEIEEHQRTISDRESSISRLLKEVETGKSDLAAQQAATQAMQAEVEAKIRELAGFQDKVGALQQSVSQRDEHIAQLDAALATSRETIGALESKLDASAQQAEQLQRTADKLRDATQMKEQLEGVIAERNLKITALSSEAEELTGALVAARAKSAEAAALADQQCADANAKTAESQTQVDRLKQEIEDLNAGLAQQERWTGKLKASLGEREALGNKLNQQIEALNAQLVSANAELEYQQTAQQLLEAEKKAAEQRAADFAGKVEQANAERANAELALARAELAAKEPVAAEPPAAEMPDPEPSGGESRQPEPVKLEIAAAEPSACESVAAPVQVRSSAALYVHPRNQRRHARLRDRRSGQKQRTVMANKRAAKAAGRKHGAARCARQQSRLAVARAARSANA